MSSDRNDNYIIMNAGDHSDGKAPITACIDIWGNNQTILVGKLEYARGRYTPVFVSSAGTGWFPKDTEFPQYNTYTEETGMGHRNFNKELIILNVVEVIDGKLCPRNMEGVTSKRTPWTFK